LPPLILVDQNTSVDFVVFPEPLETKALMSNEPEQDGCDAAAHEGSLARAMTKYFDGDSSELGMMVLALHAYLLKKARNKLNKAPHLQSVTDAEGAVSSAIGSYLRALENGKFRDMTDSNELRGLLVTFVVRKAGHQMRKHSSGKAGKGKVISEPEYGLDTTGREQSPIEIAVQRETVGQMEAVIERWHALMREKGLLELAERILEGQGRDQIAGDLKIRKAKLGRLITTVNKLTEVFGQEEKQDE
jgi:hypothetical protein